MNEEEAKQAVVDILKVINVGDILDVIYEEVGMDAIATWVEDGGCIVVEL